MLTNTHTHTRKQMLLKAILPAALYQAALWIGPRLSVPFLPLSQEPTKPSSPTYAAAFAHRHKAIRDFTAVSRVKVALTSIQELWPLTKTFDATEPNGGSLDWMSLLVMRGRKELCRFWQAVWVAVCVSKCWHNHNNDCESENNMTIHVYHLLTYKNGIYQSTRIN